MKRRNIVCGRQEELSSKMRKIFGEKRYFCGGQEKGRRKMRKSLEREMFGQRRRRKGGKYSVRGGGEERRRKRRKIFWSLGVNRF